MGGGHGTDWEAYWDNGDPDPVKGLVIYQDSSDFIFSLGRAYWLLRRGPVALNVTVPSSPLDAAASVDIPLHAGWNLITNPYSAPVSWSAIRSANGLPSSDPLYGYDGSFSVRTGMSAGEGYVYFNTAVKPSLRIPFEAIRGALVKSREEELPGVWNIRIALRSGSISDDLAAFGVAPGASARIDTLDFRRPRSIGRVPSVYFDRSEWDPVYSVFACDIRPPTMELETWDFEVDLPIRESAELSFAGVEMVPEGLMILLFDHQTLQSLDLRDRAEYGFRPSLSHSRFSVLVGSPDAVRKELEEKRPSEFVLGDNYPNPFNPTTTIPLTVPERSEVTLTVYDVLGAEVRRLHHGFLAPGRYWFTWDGTTENGSPVATGMYLSRMTSSTGMTKTKKMILVK